MTRATCGSRARTTAIALPVASTTTSSCLLSVRPKPSSPALVMSTRPAGRSLPASQNTTSAKVRWMSMPITRPILRSFASRLRWEQWAHDNYGSALSAQPGGSQGRPATNTSSQLNVRVGLPTDVLPVPLVPDGRTIHQDRRPSRTSRHRNPHTGYKRDREVARGVQASDKDPDRAAVGENRCHVVLGLARFRPDHDAKGGWLADAS